MGEIEWEDRRKTPGGEIEWEGSDKSATAGDRAQAAAAGVNRGALANVPGLPVDAILNIWDLLKAGAGYVGGKVGVSPRNLPQLTDRATIPMSSDWIADRWRDVGVGVDPNAPDDQASRVLFAGGNAASQAMLMGGARPTKAPLPPKTAPAGATRTALASEPSQIAKDFAMAGASGMVGQGVAEATDNQALGLLASFGPQLATHYGPAGVRGAVRGKDGQAMRDRIEALRDAGVENPSAGLASGTRRGTWIDAMLSKLPGSAGVYAKNAEGVQSGMQARVNAIRDATSENSSPLTAGQSFQDAILGGGGYKDKFNRIYDKKDDIASGFIDPKAKFAVPNTLGAADNITALIPGALNVSEVLQTARMPDIAARLRADAIPHQPKEPLPGRDVPSIFRTIDQAIIDSPQTPIQRTIERAATDAPHGYGSILPNEAMPVAWMPPQGGLPYAAIRGLSTKIGREAASTAIVGTPEQADFKSLYAALARDKMGAAQASGGPKAVAALEDANAFYSSGRKQIDKLAPFVSKGGQAIAPETTFARIESAVRATPSLAESILGSVRGDVRAAQAATIVDRLGRANPGVQNAEGDQFSSNTFLTRYHTMSSESKRAIFNEGLRRDLDAVAKAADMVKSGAAVMANPSGSAITGANMGTAASAGAALLSGHPMGAIAVGSWVAGNYVSAKMLTSPVVVNWLAKTTTVPPHRIQQHLGRLMSLLPAIKDPETRADTEAFIGLLKQKRADQ